MKKFASMLIVLLTAPFVAQAAVVVTEIGFDTAANWTAGSASITSYASDHTYSESGWVFTGGPALRQTTAVQDGFAGAFDVYAWRLRDATVTWTATYTQALAGNEQFLGFGFDARRWDGSPSPAYTVSYSFDGGSNWTVASGIGSTGVLNNAAFGDTSDWSTFAQSATSPLGLAANQFIVRLAATGGERIMVDNFKVSAVPEPSTYALLLGGLTLGFILWRRRRG